MSVMLMKYFCVFSAVVTGIAVKADPGFRKGEDSSSPYSSRMILHKPCEDGWEKYKDEKCLKILDYLLVQKLNYVDAREYCKERHQAKLVSISSQEKLSFLKDYLVSKKVSGNFWIGLEHKMNSVYRWSDGTRFAYKNWAPENPKNKSGYCVQMQVDKEKFGDWSDVLCTAKNLVLCEKIQLWPPYLLQEKIMNMLSTQMIPVGFIFFQLPYQKPPTEIWPSITWKDVSEVYANVFFRVLGGDSDSFGSTQNYTAPILYAISGTPFTLDGPGYARDAVRISKGQTSAPLMTGTYNRNVLAKEYRVLKFHNSGGEVRPQNMAIRVWKRV